MSNLNLLKMKKRFLFILLILLFLVQQAKAQSVSTTVVKVGPKLGMNLSSFNEKQSFENISTKVGVNVGAVINIRGGQRYLTSAFGTGYFGLQPEIIFSMKGAVVDSENVNLSYFTIPIMLKFYATENFNLEVGPEFAFMISIPNTISNESFTYDLTELRGGKDISLAVGFGFDFDFGLSLNARYNMGFSKLAYNLPWKNSVIQISLGWLLTL
jgi:hypothetical protein